MFKIYFDEEERLLTGGSSFLMNTKKLLFHSERRYTSKTLKQTKFTRLKLNYCNEEKVVE